MREICLLSVTWKEKKGEFHIIGTLSMYTTGNTAFITSEFRTCIVLFNMSLYKYMQFQTDWMWQISLSGSHYPQNLEMFPFHVVDLQRTPT